MTRVYTGRFAQVLVAAIVLLGLAPAQASPSDDATTEVRIDRGAYIDAAAAFQALQDAVDAGGTVVVTGVFTLADDQSLSVGRYGHDVTIKADRSGGTLVGGTNTIHQTGGVEMTLAGLTIRGSHDAYVLVEATSGTTVRACQLTGLVSSGVGAVGVRVRDLPGAEAADLQITDNLIDAGNTMWAFEPAASFPVNVGIFVQDVLMDLDATIAGNRIEAAQTAGVFVSNSNGSYVIQHNEIVVAGDAAKGPFLWAIGVWGYCGTRAPRSFVVAHNDITAAGSVAAVGYGNFLPDVANPSTVLVHHNQVHVIDGVFSTFILHGNVDGSVWKQNTVDGSTVNVFAMLTAKRGPAEGNLFDKNDIDVVLLDGAPHPYMGPAPPSSHLYFGIGANNNFAKGFATLVSVNRGQGNIIR